MQLPKSTVHPHFKFSMQLWSPYHSFLQRGSFGLLNSLTTGSGNPICSKMLKTVLNECSPQIHPACLSLVPACKSHWMKKVELDQFWSLNQHGHFHSLFTSTCDHCKQDITVAYCLQLLWKQEHFLVDESVVNFLTRLPAILLLLQT